MNGTSVWLRTDKLIMFYQILVQSSRGSDLVLKEYREDGIPKLGDVFRSFLEMKQDENDLLPAMEVNGKYMIHIRCNGLYFICSASQDEPPFAALELLERLSGLVKDFCGIISEEAVVQNTALVYELLDEVMDYGIVLSTSTRSLKPYIQTEPVAVKADRQIEGILGITPGLFGSDFQIAPSNSPDKPLALSQQSQGLGSQKNEVYLDIIERITVLVSANGSVVQSELNGTVHLRSFLIGNPELVIGLSEDLVIGRGSPVNSGPGVRLDQAQFHPAVSLAEFEQHRVLRAQSQEGETSLMKYGISNYLPSMLPFQLEASMTEITDKQIVEIELHIKCHVSPRHHAVNVKVNLPLPKATTDVSPSLHSQTHTMDYKRGDRSAVWCIKKMIGGTNHTAKLRIHLEHINNSSLIEIGPASLEFELKDFTSSQLQIRFLKVFDKHNSYVPFRWVRYATLSDSYVIRLR